MNNLLLIQKYFIKILILTIFLITLPAISQAKASLIPIYQQELSQEKRLTEGEIKEILKEAEKLVDKGTKESQLLAIKKYERLLTEYQLLENKKGQANCYYEIAAIKLNLANKQQALEDIKQALALYQAVGDKKGEGRAFVGLGLIYGRLDDKNKQMEYYLQGLSILKDLGDDVGKSRVLHNLGVLLADNGEVNKALEYLEEALLLREKINDKSSKLRTLGKLGRVYLQIGKSQKALEYLQKALELEKSLNNIRDKAVLSNDIGTVYVSLKDYQRAIDYYQEALTLARLSRDMQTEATLLDNISNLYRYLNNKEKALEYALQSLTLNQKVGRQAKLWDSLSNVGINYLLLGDYQKAENCLNQALEIVQKSDYSFGQAKTLNFIGRLKVATKDLEQAKEYFYKSLGFYERAGYIKGKINSLYYLVLLEMDENLPKAINLLKEALVISEDLQSNILDQGLKEVYLANVQNLYEVYIDLLIKSGEKESKNNYINKALEINEKRRARSLRELLRESYIDIRQGVDTQLLEKEKEIQVKLSVKEQQKLEILAKKIYVDNIEKIDKEIRDLIYQIKETQAQIKINSPAYATLTQIQDISLPEIQSLLDGSTVLLEYSLGNDNSHIWLVTNDNVQYYKLASRAEIEKQAKIVYNLLISKSLPSNVKNTSSLDSEYNLAVTKLSELVLSPISSQLANKRLLIVADGMLQYIPFAILSKNNSLNQQVSFSPLILENEVINLPSAATLLLLREKKEKLIDKTTITIVADPIFSKNDPRIKQSIAKNKIKTEDKVKNKINLVPIETFRSKEINSINDLSRLPFSRQEATIIAGLLPRENYQQFLDFDADYELLTTGKLPNNKILHFATHSIINNEYPELSGIVLSLVDKEGNPKNGFLQLQEIYNLKFSADLVVLSACQTALGKEIKGEGLVGLTRGFMYAGAKQVIASLWKVDDRATAELMKYFYQNLLKNNQSPSQTLRQAQLQMMRQPRWKSPYYWAAFVLQGDFE